MLQTIELYTEAIHIEVVEHSNKISIVIPSIPGDQEARATLFTKPGQTIHVQRLNPGLNSISLKAIPHRSFMLRVETVFQTIAREINRD